MGIYVAVPCLKEDDHLEHTINSAVGQAAFGHLITVAVAIANNENFYNTMVENFSHMPNVVIKHIQDEIVTFGKLKELSTQMVEKEDYFLLIHPHTQFIPNWDIYLTSRYYDIYHKTDNKKIVFTGYPGNYELRPIGEVVVEEELSEYMLYPSDNTHKKIKDISEDLELALENNDFLTIDAIYDSFIFTDIKNLKLLALNQDKLDYKEFLNNGCNLVYPGKISAICHFYQKNLCEFDSI